MTAFLVRRQKFQVTKNFSQLCVCFVFLFLFSSFAAKHPAFSIKGLVTLKVIFLTNMGLGSGPCVYTTRIFFNF